MTSFPYQHLDAYQKAVDLSAELMSIGESGDLPPVLREMLTRGGLSVLHHLVMGCRLSSSREKKAYFSGAVSSLHDSVPVLDLLHRRGWLDQKQHLHFTNRFQDLCRMVSGLARSVDRLQSSRPESKTDRPPLEARPAGKSWSRSEAETES